jgi:uncharacterized membrane protein YdjX (TVP38/TMEM64 family)
MQSQTRSERWASWAIGSITLIACTLVLAWAWTSWDASAVAEWKRSANPFLFFSAMAILPGLGLPITPFYVLAGATFGVGKGFLGCMIAVALHFSLCHALTRGRMRHFLKGLLQRFNYKLPNYGEREGALRFATMIKLAPGVPGFFKNYLLGLAGVPFGLYMGVCMAFAAAYAFPLMVLGDSLGEHDAQRVFVALAMIVAVAVGLWLWRGRQTRKGASMS